MSAELRTREPAPPGRVAIVTRRWWVIRGAREMGRYSLCALSLAGLAASARFAIAPPRPAAAAPARAAAPADQAAQGYAVLFARRYLTWNAADPQASARELEPFLGAGIEPDAGRVLPATGAQTVEWAEVVQARTAAPGEHVYTVAAQTDTSGLLYLTVGVRRLADGALALSGYPAFVGAPASAPGRASAQLREVSDGALLTVVERALRNYLAASPAELAADLSGDASVSLPAVALSVDSIEHVDWSTDRRSVTATVQAQDTRGVEYTLGYELDVVRAEGRWEISAVQMDPDS